MLRLYFAASLFAAVSQPCDFSDGLCAPEECHATQSPCSDGAVCHHGVCLTDCNGAGGCDNPAAKCINDGGAEFCADAGGLPVKFCEQSDTE